MLPEKHIFICIANRPPAAGGSCGAAGSREILERLQMRIMEKGLEAKARVNGCTCLGPCDQGVNMIVYPEGVFYTRVTPEDVDEIVSEHLMEDRPVERLIFRAPAPQ